MKTRKVMKQEAKHSLKKHYLLFVMICLLAAFIGAEGSSALNGVNMQSDTDATTDAGTTDTTVTTVGATESDGSATSAITEMLLGNITGAKQIAGELKDQAVQNTKDGNGSKVLGRSRGVLAGLVNYISSGSFAITLISACYSIGVSKSAVMMLMILGSALASFLFYYFCKNVYIVVSRRMFLEGRLYDKVPIQRMLFLVKVRKWAKAAWVMFVEDIYMALWAFTIIGLFIKPYSYAMVPYIVAENPDMKANEAITLSRKMMNGHKWELFVMYLTFIGWDILSVFTVGLSAIFYSDPYKDATITEYYAEIRRLAKENHIEGAERLDDEWLFKKPETDAVRAAYADQLAMVEAPEEESYQLKGFRGFIANVFGIILFNSKEEKKYEENQMRIIRYRNMKMQVELACYPCRMSPIPEKSKNKKVSTLYYMRHYTVWSLILLFFIFSFIGWVWEVSLHLVSDGVFVNRGTMYGPWLPIYGTGGVMILVLLNKLRKTPVAEFICAIILCGCVEYFSAYYLEMTHGGKKWWDYSGYFLNLDGRICAEGLLVFGLGGMAIVYFLAPLLDNHLKKIPYKVVIPICIVLLGIYSVDKVYSGKHPNEGKGITDYAGASIERTITDLPDMQYRI